MACEQGDLVPGVGIVEPDADAGGHRQPHAVGRIGHLIDAAFAKAGERAVGQIPAGIVLGAAVLREQDAGQQQGDVEQWKLFHLRFSFR